MENHLADQKNHSKCHKVISITRYFESVIMYETSFEESNERREEKRSEAEPVAYH